MFPISALFSIAYNLTPINEMVLVIEIITEVFIIALMVCLAAVVFIRKE